MKRLLKITALVLVILTMTVGLISCKKAEFNANKNVSVVTREDGSGTKSAFM